MSFSSPTPELTPSVGSPSPPPNIPTQPDHFYGGEPILSAPDSTGKTWLDPNDDRLATRGIPVFKPTMDEFRDFESYMTRVEPWGMISGIVKVIPPKEWKDALPPLNDQLKNVQIKSPIEQEMLGQAGLFRQQNYEKKKVMSVRDWAELCAQDAYRAPGVDEIGVHARASVKAKPRKGRKTATKAETVEPELAGQVHIKEEPADESAIGVCDGSRSASVSTPDGEEQKSKTKARRQPQSRLTKEERNEKDEAFLETFDPHSHWLPPGTKPEDYTPEFCAKLERHYWRNCGLGKSPWYGADTQVEDMDLFSINYIHFGAPKFWYAVPQGRASALENAMRSNFPKDTSQCHQFLRHKSFLASPTLLAKSSCKPNHCVQQPGEFMITYPRGYHAGFNLGFNCAESVNFALKSWLELGKVAKACECIPDSVRIDVNKLLEQRDRRERRERGEESDYDVPSSAVRPRSKPKRPSVNAISRSPTKKAADKKAMKREELIVVIPPLPRIGKRKSEHSSDDSPKPKKPKTKSSASTHVAAPSSSQLKPTIKLNTLKITLKLGPSPQPDVFPCCLCISKNKEGLLRVQDPPLGRKEAVDACGYARDWVWMAHRDCASIVPETWVDQAENPRLGTREEVVFGVDCIVKDRWNLKCSACSKSRLKAHGAPIQCTRGKCSKAFHISCARDVDDNNVVFNILNEVEKEVVFTKTDNTTIPQMDVDSHPTIDANGMAVDHSQPIPQMDNAEVLKSIKKFEVEVLCTQHNPAVAARKKASKQDRIKQELATLPAMARIKIRVSAGVFEVTLMRVIEETGSVEVLWDRGMKREFKWGSVVFGTTDEPIQIKPSEPAPVEDFQPLVRNVPSIPSYTAVGTHSHPPPSQQPLATPPTAGTPLPPMYPGHPYWGYPGHTQIGYGQTYNSDNPYIPVTAPVPVHVPHPHTSSSNYAITVAPLTPAPGTSIVNQHYRHQQLQWQTPYGPPSSSEPEAANRVTHPSQLHSQPQPHPQQSSHYRFSMPLTSQPPVQAQQPPDSIDRLPTPHSESPITPHTPHTGTPAPWQIVQSAHSQSGTGTTSGDNNLVNTSAQTPDVSEILSGLTPSQLAEIIQNNPNLRGTLLSAVESNGTVEGSISHSS